MTVISFADLLPRLGQIEQLGPRDYAFTCPRCGARASVKSFGRGWSAKCETCGKLGEDDLSVPRPERGGSNAVANGAAPAVNPVRPGGLVPSGASAAQPAQEDRDEKVEDNNSEEPNDRRTTDVLRHRDSGSSFIGDTEGERRSNFRADRSLSEGTKTSGSARAASVGEADVDVGNQALEEVSEHIPRTSKTGDNNATPGASNLNGAGGGRAYQPNFTHRDTTVEDYEPKPKTQPRAAKPPSRGISTADDILRRKPPQDIEAEQSVLGAILLDNEAIAKIGWLSAESFYREAHREIYRAFLSLRSTGDPIDAVTLAAILRARGQFEAIGGASYIIELADATPTAANIQHYAAIVRDMALKRDIAMRATQLASLAYDGVSADGLVGEMERLLKPIAASGTEIISWEGFGDAVAANEEYLRRTPIIDKLCYSSAVSLITGGKHAGKSTLARWMAICVAKGWSVLGREVTQGPVFYIASEDETMAARQELIRLGWCETDALKFFSAQAVDNPDKFLLRLTDEIRRHQVVFVVLDMLFDFVRIADEMSYAGTRAALGKLQNVATISGAHLMPIHHAPKNAAIGDAAVAALGSQGLAARVSPIILVRRFGPGVHSISSTAVRDPRGQALVESRLLRNEDGSVVLGGAWKNYMLAEVYTDRVLELLDAEEGGEYTASDVAQDLDISYQVASKCLALLARQGVVGRTGSGKKGKPFRYSRILGAPNNTAGITDKAENMALGGTAINTNPDSGRYGYKD